MLNRSFVWTLAGLILAMPLFLSTSLLAAQEDSGPELDALKKENAQLNERVATLEAAVKAIQQQLREQNEMPEMRVAEVSEAGTKDKPGVRSKLPLTLYGFAKLDAAYDSSRTDDGNYARWVESETANRGDSQFNMTARQTRLGMNFEDYDLGRSLKTGGKVEVDFYGGGAENKNALQMRHAYMNLKWEDQGTELLGGQTWDLISPLNPSTLNYTVAWWAGNLGYRRPQVRLTRNMDVGESSQLTLAGALTRTIGEDWGFDPGDTGEDSGFPTLQGRAGVSFPFMDKTAGLGLSGHWGEEEYDSANDGTHQNFDTWSGNLDLSLPLWKGVTLKGELWSGENLDAYLGGIGQGVNQTLLQEISSKGGWAALNFPICEKWQINLGAAIDDPDNDDLNNGDRSENRALWGNAIYNMTDFTQVGLELSSWETKYKNQGDGSSTRVQSSVIHKF